MKTSTILIGASAAFVAAQVFPDGFPECGTTCITNMLNMASDFNCTSDNAVCLCSAVDFIYGVRDCSDQYCPSAEDASVSKNYGVNYCAQAGIDIEGITGASPTVSGSTMSLTITATASPTTPPVSSGSTSSTGSASSASSGSDVTVTTTGVTSSSFTSTLVTQTGSVTSSAAEASSSAAGGSETTDESGSGSSPTSAGASSTSSNVAHPTAAPVGMMAAAGLAALLL